MAANLVFCLEADPWPGCSAIPALAPYCCGYAVGTHEERLTPVEYPPSSVSASRAIVELSNPSSSPRESTSLNLFFPFLPLPYVYPFPLIPLTPLLLLADVGVGDPDPLGSSVYSSAVPVPDMVNEVRFDRDCKG